MEYVFIIFSWAILLVSGFDDSEPPTGDKTFKIEYSDVVQSIKTTSDATLDFWGFEIELKQNSVGVLDVKIPKNFPTPASFTDSWNFDERPIVIGDNNEIDYDFVQEPCFFHYKIPVEGEKNVEIAFGIILAGKYQLYSSKQFDEDDPCYDKVFYEPPIKSPLKQIKSGIAPEDIACKKGFVLMTKPEKDSPVCVMPTTAIKLVERNWNIILNQFFAKSLVFNEVLQFKNDTKQYDTVKTNLAFLQYTTTTNEIPHFLFYTLDEDMGIKYKEDIVIRDYSLNYLPPEQIAQFVWFVDAESDLRSESILGIVDAKTGSIISVFEITTIKD